MELVEIFLDFIFYVFMAFCFVYPNGERRQRKKRAEEIKSAEIKFSKAGVVDFPPYDGEVEVSILLWDPPENSILVGSVSVTQKMDREELLVLMKEKAAKNGANFILLRNKRPHDWGGGWFFWSARAMRTQNYIEKTA